MMYVHVCQLDDLWHDVTKDVLDPEFRGHFALISRAVSQFAHSF